MYATKFHQINACVLVCVLEMGLLNELQILQRKIQNISRNEAFMENATGYSQSLSATHLKVPLFSTTLEDVFILYNQLRSNIYVRAILSSCRGNLH